MSFQVNDQPNKVTVTEENIEVTVAAPGPAGPGVPGGGTAGQILAKDTNDDYDTEWVDLDDTTKIPKSIVDAKGDLIVASAADTPDRLPVGTTNQVLMADPSAPLGVKWSSEIDPTAIPKAIVDAKGDLIVASAADIPDRLPVGTTNQVLMADPAAPLGVKWSSEIDPTAISKSIVDAKGDLIVASAADTPDRLPVGTTNQVLMADPTAPLGVKWSSEIDPTAISKSIVDAKGDLIVASADDTPDRLPVGSTNQIIVADSTQPLGVKWADLDDTTKIPKAIVDAKGDLIVASGADTPVRVGVGADGQVLTAASGETAGVKWDSPQLVGGAARPLLTGGAYLSGSGLVLSGLAPNYASSPDSAALDITGDIEITARMSAIDWQGNWCVVAKRTLADGLSWQIATGTNFISFAMRTGGVDYFNNYQASTTSLVDGTTYWLRFTRTASTGVVTIEYANDSVTEPTVWTSMSPTGTAVPGNIDANNAPVEFGSNRSGGFQNLPGTIRRVIIRNGIGGTVALDANFETATADALAFTESSSNAATVTINTTRYTYGLPNVQWSTSNATQALTANTVYYQPFLLTAPAIVDGTQFVVTTGPASSANVRTGIYAADSNLQPTGAPILDAGNTTVGTSATGTFFKQVSPVTLQPGMYVTAINTSVALTCRVVRGGIVGADAGSGTSSIVSLMSGSQTQGAFPNPGTAWNTRTFSTTGPNHMLFLRWRAA